MQPTAHIIAIENQEFIQVEPEVMITFVLLNVCF